MGKFSGMLLASDFDGTLADSKGEIPAFVREKLSYFIAEGGFFTVCTGRSGQGFHAWDSAIMNAPALVANGQMAYDYAEKRTVFAEGAAREDCGVLWEVAARFPSVGFELYTPDFGTFAYRMDARSRQHLERQFISYAAVTSLEEVPFPLVKIMFSCGRETAQALQRFFNAVDLGRLAYNPTGGDFVELLRADCGKGVGLLRLASLLGIPKNRVFAVGDGDNDLQLLSAAAAGFAPENACSEAKAVASFIVPSNDRGAVGHVVDLLETRILKQSG